MLSTAVVASNDGVTISWALAVTALDKTSQGRHSNTEEALTGEDLRALTRLAQHQPSWSDLPLIILTHAGGGADSRFRGKPGGHPSKEASRV